MQEPQDHSIICRCVYGLPDRAERPILHVTFAISLLPSNTLLSCDHLGLFTPEFTGISLSSMTLVLSHDSKLISAI